MFNIHEKTFQLGRHSVTLRTGKIARQATGSVEVIIGDTILLVTAVAATEASPNQSFFPLSVHYQEKTYAVGKIPGSFFRREGRPSEKEILLCRLIDRPIRPLFPKGFMNEVQIVATVVSLDESIATEVPAMLGASAALMLAGVPFNGPIGASKVGYIDGEFVLNPSSAQLKKSALDLSVAGTEDAVLMVESEASQLSEDVMLEAVMFGHQEMQVAIQNIRELAEVAGKPAWDWQPAEESQSVKDAVQQFAHDRIVEAYQTTDKQQRQSALKQIRGEVLESVVNQLSEAEEEVSEGQVKTLIGNLEKQVVRQRIINNQPRIDGRNHDVVRPISCEVGLLARAHGSALFTRGETQALVSVTLGTDRDAQLMDELEGKYDERFLFHYNFPPYSVGECGRMMGPGRREVGHGKLAKRALQEICPDQKQFPYVMRIVSEITESNGSSSMASVCGSSMAMMDAGVPLQNSVSGIAMGLVKEGDDYVILSDIMGDEDHLGDMDFKVAGTENGITALQMDIKIQGITHQIMQQALQQAKEGRLHILSEMAKAISTSNSDLSPYAPRVMSIKVAVDKIGDVIGKGGATIRALQEQTGSIIDISDDGTVTIATSNQDSAEQARIAIENLTKDIEVNEVYEGKVMKILEFGAFVNILPGKDGLLHISEIDKKRIDKVQDYLTEGEIVKVKVINVDKSGKIKLSRKALLD